MLAVSLRTPVACSICRKDHPSFPSAMTCCFFSSLKTLLMPREPISAPFGVNVPGSAMAGFQVTLYGRFWVTPEVYVALAPYFSSWHGSPSLFTLAYWICACLLFIATALPLSENSATLALIGSAVLSIRLAFRLTRTVACKLGVI